jgi:hypothetical protein
MLIPTLRPQWAEFSGREKEVLKGPTYFDNENRVHQIIT